MPRCGTCHSQWATFFRCPHCEAKFPCPFQLLLVSFAIPAVIAAAVYVLSSFAQRVEHWQAVIKAEPVVVQPRTVEIDKSGVVE